MLTGKEPRCYQLLNGGTALCSDAFQDCWSFLLFCFGLVTPPKQRWQVGGGTFVLGLCTHATTWVKQLECMYTVIDCVREGGGEVQMHSCICSPYYYLNTLHAFLLVRCSVFLMHPGRIICLKPLYCAIRNLRS